MASSELYQRNVTTPRNSPPHSSLDSLAVELAYPLDLLQAH